MATTLAINLHAHTYLSLRALKTLKRAQSAALLQRIACTPDSIYKSSLGLAHYEAGASTFLSNGPRLNISRLRVSACHSSCSGFYTGYLSLSHLTIICPLQSIELPWGRYRPTFSIISASVGRRLFTCCSSACPLPTMSDDGIKELESGLLRAFQLRW